MQLIHMFELNLLFNAVDLKVVTITAIYVCSKCSINGMRYIVERYYGTLADSWTTFSITFCYLYVIKIILNVSSVNWSY